MARDLSGENNMMRLLTGIAFILVINPSVADETSDMIARGKEIYFQPGSCVTCHAEDAKGLIGPDITYGPSPYQIWDQFDSNPQMKPLYENLDPSDDDLVASPLTWSVVSGRDIDDAQLTMLKETLGARPRQYAGKMAIKPQSPGQVDRAD